MSEWVDAPYLPSPPAMSVDGADTSHGVLYHAVPPRWGHSMHRMCSYQGMFPARLAHYFIEAFSSPGDVVLDPFCGRGTTVLQSRIDGRPSIGIDLNPLAYVLSRAKGHPPRWNELASRIGELERACARVSGSVDGIPGEIRMLFHESTLSQLAALRTQLMERPWSAWSASDFMIAGATAGILHGRGRRDGTSAYLSIDMPNTFSMAPEYVKTYIADKGLVPKPRSVFVLLREKLARLYVDDPAGARGRVLFADAVKAMTSRITEESVDLILTSPPYLKVVNYATSNWIRLWWLGVEEASTQLGHGRKRLDQALDHGHSYESYRTFMHGALQAMSRVLRKDGTAVVVIGDVAAPGRSPRLLAEEVWADVGEESGLELVDIVADTLPHGNKVSRMMGRYRGRATEVDRALILQRRGSTHRVPNDVSWRESYRDAGPDEAHLLLERAGLDRVS